MSIIYILLAAALLLGGGFLLAFILSSLTGQYEDLDTPAHRILLDDEAMHTPQEKKGHAV